MVPYIKWLKDTTHADIAQVGGKNANLGEMIGQLASKGVSVPDGFCTTSAAYRYFIETNGLKPKLRELFKGLDVENIQQLQDTGRQARSLILSAPLPDDLAADIKDAYFKLSKQYGVSNTDVAVRSSATAEDLPEASFAGQQETFLNVHGLSSILDACIKCFASLFTDRAIVYRVTNQFDHFDVALSCAFQKMVRSDESTSGVMFTLDTETGFPNTVLLTAAYGLGEMVVQGTVNPDEYIIFKPKLKEGFNAILSKTAGTKEVKMVYETGRTKSVKIIPVPVADRKRFCLSDDDILTLAKWGCIIEDHYSALNNKFTPMDIEWARDGLTNRLFIVQARQETVHARRNGENIIKTFRLKEKPSETDVIARGKSVGAMVGSGPVIVATRLDDVRDFPKGAVLVTNRTDPDWEPIMKRAAAIVTNQGGRTCHAAIIARELGVPAVVGCIDATERINPKTHVTVSCCEGEEGKVYGRAVPFEVLERSLDAIPETRTKIMMNVANPSEAFGLSAMPVAGVGLARMEFIIANGIKVHPLALLEFDKVKDFRTKLLISEMVGEYVDKPQFFVDTLASGIGTIAAAFYPRQVIVRMSDFKTNEYRNLIGGIDFEPLEENPMLGWRGASRYYDHKYEAAFGLECRALLKCREVMGLFNITPMIPFCRSTEEARKVIETMAKFGLKRGERGEHGLQVYMMCEIPANVILAEEFAKHFDGFSIGSNDLTQLVMGVDRDSAQVAHVFDERNEAVKSMISTAISKCKKSGIKIGICGEAPSNYPEFARFLVDCGIDSMSLSAGSVLGTILDVSKYEKSIRR